MKKLFISSIVFLYLTACLPWQIAHGQTMFQKLYGGTNGGGDEANSVKQTTDGGYILCGWTENFGAGKEDIYLIRLNSDGDTLWTKTFGGSGYEEGFSVEQTIDGGFALVGWTTLSFGNHDNVYVIKTNSSGNLLWSKTIGTTSNEEGFSIKETNDLGFVITGYNSNADIYLIKIDSNGNLLWTQGLGGNNYDVGYSIQQTIDGGFVLAGYTKSFGVGNADAYLIKTDSDGNLLWSKAFGTTDTEVAYSVQQSNDGGFIIAGGTGIVTTFGSVFDIYLIKTDSNGNLSWSKTFDTGGDDNGFSVQQTKDDSSFVIIGNTSISGIEYVYLLKTDTNGNLLWSKTYGDTYGGSGGKSIYQTNDDGFIIAGRFNNISIAGLYLIKTDSNGNSGCDENSPTTIVSNPPTIMTTPATQTSSGGATGTPPTQIKNGSAYVTFCYSNLVNEINPKNSIIIFPNPFSSATTLQSDKPFKNATLTAYNSFGQQVKEIKNISGQEIILHRDNLPSGIYFICLTQDNKILARDKLIITDN